MSTELLVLSKANKADLFIKPEVMAAVIGEVKTTAEALVAECSLNTKSGRKEIASIAYKVAKSKTLLTSIAKEQRDEIKAKIAPMLQADKSILAASKDAAALLDEIKNDIRQPVTDWEEAETSRLDEYAKLLEWLNDLATNCTHANGSLFSSADYDARVEKLESFDMGQDFEEFTDRVLAAFSKARAGLDERHGDALKREREAVELEEFRKMRAEKEQQERDDRIAKEAAERATRQAHEEAQARQAAVERETAMAKERAEREKQLAVEAEKRRQSDELARVESERLKREADVAHKQEVNTKALKALIAGGIDETQARDVLALISRGLVPGVSINY